MRTHVGSEGGEQNKGKLSQVTRTLNLVANPWAIGYPIIYAFMNGVIPLIYMVILGSFLNTLFYGASMETITKLFYRFLIFGAVLGILVSGMNFGVARLSSSITYTTSLTLFNSILNEDIEFFDANQTGDILAKLSEDVVLIQYAFGIFLGASLFWGAQMIAAVVVTAIYYWQVAFIVFGAIVVAIFIIYYGQKYENNLIKKKFKLSLNSLSKAQETVSSMRIVKSFDCELNEIQEYENELKIVEGAAKNLAEGKGIIVFVVSCLFWGSIAVTLWVLGYAILKGTKQLGVLIIIISAFLFSFSATSLFGGSLNEFKKGGVAASKVWHINDRVQKIKLKVGRSYENVKGHIEVRNVNFTYPTRQETQVLRDLSMEIPEGKTVAIVGESGCGKSTILSLIQRFYDVDSGEILFDGNSIKELSPDFIHHIVTCVPQSPVLFSMSIADNIRYGKPSATMDEIVQAAITANCSDFIEALPDKYETAVTPNSLSGGERQRICIARAVLLNSPILLLDEATASLDATSEQLVQEAINRAVVGRTTIIVAHRLSTIRNADVIYVMKHGQIAERGTHDSLLALHGEYSALIARQL